MGPTPQHKRARYSASTTSNCNATLTTVPESDEVSVTNSELSFCIICDKSTTYNDHSTHLFSEEHQKAQAKIVMCALKAKCLNKLKMEIIERKHDKVKESP